MLALVEPKFVEMNRYFLGIEKKINVSFTYAEFFLTDRLRTALISEFKLPGLRTELYGVQELLVLSHTPGRDIEISLDDDDWPYENVEYLNRRMNALSREGRHRQRGSSTTKRADTPAPRYNFIDSNKIRGYNLFQNLL